MDDPYDRANDPYLEKPNMVIALDVMSSMTNNSQKSNSPKGGIEIPV